VEAAWSSQEVEEGDPHERGPPGRDPRLHRRVPLRLAERPHATVRCVEQRGTLGSGLRYRWD
jgi:hypothetical protein